MQKQRCVVLLSGGLDSATTLAVAKKEGFDIHAITFQYGQRHHFEVKCAQRVAEYFNVTSHTIVQLPDIIFKSSSLIASSTVPPSTSSESAIPLTYVPARNIVFLSIALAYAETIQASHIFIGVNSIDFSGYPDCRQEFIEAFQNVINVGTKTGVEGKPIKVVAPLINLTKAEIISLGVKLGVDYSLTSSCYNPSIDGKPCGMCDSCSIRKKGFQEAGIEDPLMR